MSEELESLWKLAIHEAGHGVIAIVLGGQCTGVAIYGGGGGARLDGLDHHDELGTLFSRRHAIATAAGPAAEVLADRFPVPTETPAAHRKLTIDEFLANPDDVRNLIADNQARPDEDRFLVSDDRKIAEWAIGGNEQFPETWAGRVADVHRAAAELVEQNAEAIARLATALYVRGSLDEDQVSDCLNGDLT